MATKYLDSNGLLYLWQKIRNTFVSDVTWDSTNKKLIRKKKTGANGAEESTDIVTFSTVATSGSYNDLSNKPTIPTLKNVFGKVKVGSSTIEADTTQDTLELSAGSGVTLTADTTNDKVTISADAGTFVATYDSTTFSEITSAISAGKAVFVQDTSANILAPVVEVTNADVTFASIVFQNNVGTVVTLLTCDSSSVWGSYDHTVVIDVVANNSSIVDGTGVASLSDATTSASGLMSTTDKSKLDGIASGAEVNVNADWNSASGDSQILNKPTLGTASAKGVVSSISSDSNDLPTVTAVKNYVASAVSGSTAFQGTVTSSFAPTNYLAGYYWVVGTAGTYAGQVCEAGDMIFAIEDGTTYSASKFDVVQTNLDISNISNGDIDTIVAS